MSVLETLWAAHHDPRSRIYSWWQGTIWFLVVLAIGLLVLEGAAGFDESAAPWLLGIDRTILGVFALDVLVRGLTYRPPRLEVFDGTRRWRLRQHILARLRYTLTPLVLVDLVTVLALVPELRALRALRAPRLIGLLTVFL